MAHLAGLLQALKGVGHLVGVQQRVGAVDQQQVEVVGTQVAQRGLDTGGEVRRRGVVVLDLPAALGDGRFDAALAHQLQFVAARGVGLQPAAEQRFTGEATVQVGVVEGADAQCQGVLYPGGQRGVVKAPLVQAPHASRYR